MSDANILRFVVEDDDGNRSVVPLEPGEVTLGRDADNTVTLPDRNISRHHAKLQLDARGVGHVEDLGSYNGVVLNGTRILGRHNVRAGDVLRLGDVQLELRSSAAELMVDEATERHEPVRPEGTEPGVQLGPRRALGEEATLPNGGLMALASEETLPGETARPAAQSGDAAAASAVPGPPYAKLLCLGAPRQGVAFELTRVQTVFGRTGESHVALDHPSISRQHAIVSYDGQAFVVRDAGSANGTFVNGTGTKDQRLGYGDVLELGHVRLRLVAPGEAAALTAAEREQARKEAAPPSRASKLMVPAAAVVALGLAFGAASLLLRKPGPKNQLKPLTLSLDDPAASAGSEDEAQSLMQQARLALEARQYARAGALANAVLAIDPKDPKGALKAAAQALVAKAGCEERGEQGLSAAKKAVVVQAWPDAFNALQTVPKDSSFAADGEMLMGTVRPALVKDRLAEARESADGHDWEEVDLLVQEVAGLSPSSSEQAELEELRRAVTEGRNKHAAAKAPAAAATPPPSSGKNSSKPAHGGKGGHADAERRAQGASDDAKLMYAEGTRALGQGQLQRAIDSFNRCLVADKSFSMCYRALGIAYAKSGSGAKAARFYRLYLKVDPNARDAQQVRALLQQYNSQPDPSEATGEHSG